MACIIIGDSAFLPFPDRAFSFALSEIYMRGDGSEEDMLGILAAVNVTCKYIYLILMAQRNTDTAPRVLPVS